MRIVPLKQAVISCSALSLMYPAEEIPGYSREEFIDDLLREHENEVRNCLRKGAHVVQIDFTEGRLAVKVDPSGNLLHTFIDLNNLALSRFSAEERARIGVHTCPGGDLDSTHSADVDYAELLPSLFELNVGNFYIALAGEKDRIRVLKIIRKYIKPSQRVFVGVISPIDPRIETPEEVRDRIIEAASYIPLEQFGQQTIVGFRRFVMTRRRAARRHLQRLRRASAERRWPRQSSEPKMKDEEEEQLLKNVTLQGARSIYLARKRAEEELVRAKDALAKQSELLRVTLTSIGDAVITTDTEGKVETLNPVAEELTGWTQSEALGRPLAEIFKIFNEKTRKPVENPAERALLEGRVVGLANHTVLVSKSGTETPIDDSAAPIRDEEGRVHGVVLIFRSVAERKIAERALRESEQELADFFENASVGMHWVGPDGTILRVNQSELNLLGYSPDEYLGHHIAEFHVNQNVIADILRRLAAGEILRDYEAQMRCRDGSIKDVLIDSSVLWKDEQFMHTRCVTRDITDRKRAEEAQAQLAAIVESSQDAIISKTLEGEIPSWNAGAERLFGYTSAEAVGQPVTMLIPPERQDEEQMILSRLRRGESIEHYETVRVKKEGRRIEVSLTISPVRDSAGRIIGASKIARDITAKNKPSSGFELSTP